MASILITGGCGFVGSNLAVRLSASGHQVTVFDNLSRRGSERLLYRVRKNGCLDCHGDVRCPEDLRRLMGTYDALIDCSAEPSVVAATSEANVSYVIRNNLEGSVNCFEFARERRTPVIFLSTSRVYPHDMLNSVEYRETQTRFEVINPRLGLSASGLSTEFPLQGVRSLYGATKLSCELLLQEYSSQFGLPAIINRCGVIAGPWQLGKADQGVFTYWLAAHHYDRPLCYVGFGGRGKQVRDLLHVDDLSDLLEIQLGRIQNYRGDVFNVGGGCKSSLSLLEATDLCQEITGKRVEVTTDPRTRVGDIKWYITDNENVSRTFSWLPKRSVYDIVSDTHKWMMQNEAEFKAVFFDEREKTS